MQQNKRRAIDRNEISFFDRYYEENHYSRLGWRLRLERERATITAIARSYGKPLGRVLSIGCGDGQFELMLAALAEEVVGVDLSPEAIKLATQSAESAGLCNLRFECASVHDIQWEGKFDTIIALAFFHHVPAQDLPELTKRLYHGLRPGGLLYSSDPNEKALLRAIGRLIMGSSYNRFHSPDERELNPSSLIRMLQETGFKSVAITWTDFTLIPALFLLTRGPDWPLYLAKWIDAVLIHSPLRPWASSFGVSAQRT